MVNKHKVDGYTFWVSDNTSNAEDEIRAFTDCVTKDQYNVRNVVDVPPKIVFDCGSHIGSFSYLVKTLWPDAMVVVIEPNSDSMLLAQKNLLEVSDDNVVFVEGGIWYNGLRPKYFMKNDFCKTTSKFVFDEDGYDRNVLQWHKEQSKSNPYLHKEHDISLYTIEEIMERLEVSHIDLLKLDIQCAEYDLFKNTALSSSDVDVIVGELHNMDYVTDFKDKVSLFNEAFSEHYVSHEGFYMGDGEEKYVFSATRRK